MRHWPPDLERDAFLASACDDATALEGQGSSARLEDRVVFSQLTAVIRRDALQR